MKQNIKTLAKALNSIDDKKRFVFTTISDKKHIIDEIDYELESDLLHDYNDMLAKDNGDFSSLHIED